MAGLCALTGVATQAQPIAAPPPPTIAIEEIRAGKLYLAIGGGGNSGILIGDHGVIIIDAKINAEAGRALIAEVAKLTPKPITHVILTHSDGDHVNGLAGFPDGLTIIAHRNAKTELLATYLYAAVEVDGGRCLPPRNRLPNSIVRKDRVETMIDGQRIILHHFGQAHTSGDLVVELPVHKVAFVGDLITNTVLVHPEKMGSLDGWFGNARNLLALRVDDYVGGHAEKSDTKTSLRERAARYQAQRDEVDKLVRLGRSLPEVKAAMGDPAKDPSGCRGIPFPSFGEIAYHSRTEKDQELK